MARGHNREPGRFGRSGLGGVAIVGASFGAVAVGAFAIGALAIGRLAIRRVLLEGAEIGSLRIRDLSVTRLHAGEVIVSDSLELPAGDAASEPGHNPA